jgi:HSP20 family protein
MTMNLPLTRGSLFDEFFRDMSPGYFVRPLHGDALPSPAQIRMDVREGEKEYVVQADLPGVKKSDIHVNIDGNVVTLSAGIEQTDTQTRDEKVLRTERYRGALSRSFSLASDIDKATAKARYEDGVLTLTLPKMSAPGAQRITVE